MTTPVNSWSAADPQTLAALVEAEVGELRLVYDASNYVFLATLAHDEHGEGLGIYKPAQGERPLHDFPSGTLYEREVGAYQLSRLLGWNLIPPTVERDGPQGVGSMQLYIQHDPSEHYFNFREQDSLHEQLVRFAAFDLVANNADRKAGHLLLDGDGRLWGIDNGLCFHGQQKLRTVVWDFAGEPLPAGWVEDLERAAECIDSGDESAEALRRCLSEREREALAARCRELADRPVLPEMFPYRCVPWPMI